MVTSIDSYWIEAYSSYFFFEPLTLQFPQGTTVHATIALSWVDTLFADNAPDPTFSAAGFIESWTVYLPDGTQSQPITGGDFTQNAARVENCASITFWLAVERVAAMAQVNVYTL